jgi:undecaprenyl-diphosphatase
MTDTDLAFDGSRIDGGLYTHVTQWAEKTPHSIDTIITKWSSYGLAVFAVLMLIAWWQSRRSDGAAMARALAAPVVVGVVYAVDMVFKSLVQEPRPCQALPHSFTLESCPGTGDWSFPSNHATIAFTAAAAIWVVSRRLGVVALVFAALMAASRVWVGVHYPHDVLAGALVGVLFGYPLALAAAKAAPLVDKARTGPLRPLLIAT